MRFLYSTAVEENNDVGGDVSTLLRFSKDYLLTTILYRTKEFSPLHGEIRQLTT